MEQNDKQPAEFLLEHLVVTIEEQLDAAKKMDADRLQAATERRQDLLFQLEVECGFVTPTDSIVALQDAVQTLDDRLMAVLEVVNDACRSVNPSKTAKTYTAKGSITGYKV
jgi:hypothetical protein